jgi:predicted acylesterase/phospholipase RssA
VGRCARLLEVLAGGAGEGRQRYATHVGTLTELRLALAMRGGVSLAVWMGGACAETDAVRRSTPAEDQPLAEGSGGGLDASARDFWGRVVNLAGYNAVRIDVLSGTSAGGINGVLLATGAKYGICFDGYRDTWLRIGALEKLIRSTAERRPESLLDGDYFLTQLTNALASNLAEHPPNDSFVDLTLTSTITNELGVFTVDDLGTPSLEPSHRATFRFRTERGTSDFPKARADQGEENRGVAAKLALAGRSSASFPGAFQPSTVRVKRPTQLGARSEAKKGADDLFGQFSDASQDVYRLVDGGVLDNIPMTLAIRAIAASPAQVATERVLLYLDPNPADVNRPDEPVAPDFLSTLRVVQGARGTAESILDDLDELHRHNDRAFRYRALQRTIVGGLRLPVEPDALRRANDQRATIAARRARALLEDPVRTLGEDPFVDAKQTRPLLVVPEAKGSPHRRLLTPEQLEDLERAIADEILRHLPGRVRRFAPAKVAMALGTETFLHLALGLLELVRDAEGRGWDIDRELKLRLYAVLDVAGLLLHCLDLFWPVHAASSPPDPDADRCPAAWAREAWLAREQLRVALTAGQATGSLARFSALHRELQKRSEGLPGEVGRGGLEAHLWHVVEDAAKKLHPLAARLLTAAAAAGDDTPPIVEALARTEVPIAQRLLGYEIYTQQLQSISPRPPLPMKFVRVSSAQPSPANDEWFGARLTPTTKLTGNEVMNFAAFYKASWRANDWMWGRLDSAATLVNFVVQPRRLRERLLVLEDGCPPGGVERMVEQIRSAVVTIAPESPMAAADRGAYQQHLERLWGSREDAVRAELQRLAGPDPAWKKASLEPIRRAFIERRQLEILCGELPAIIRAATEDQLTIVNHAIRSAERHESLLAFASRDQLDPLHAVTTPDKLLDLCRSYEVGEETLADEVGRPRLGDVLTQLLVVGWRAVTASGSTPAVLKPLGVFLHALRAVVSGVTRLPRWALVLSPIVAIAAAAVLFSEWEAFGVLDRPAAVAVIVALAAGWASSSLQRGSAKAIAAVLALGSGAVLARTVWRQRGNLAVPFVTVRNEAVARPDLTYAVLGGLLLLAGVAVGIGAWRTRSGARRSIAAIAGWLPVVLLVTGAGAALVFAATGTEQSLRDWVLAPSASQVENVVGGGVALAVSVLLAVIAWRLHPTAYVGVLTSAVVVLAVLAYRGALNAAIPIATAVIGTLVPVVWKAKQSRDKRAARRAGEIPR